MRVQEELEAGPGVNISACAGDYRWDVLSWQEARAALGHCRQPACPHLVPGTPTGLAVGPWASASKCPTWSLVLPSVK